MVSCGTIDNGNILTIAWTGILNTIPPTTYISVRPSRFSYNIIKESGDFVINLTTTHIVKAADFCGVRSGRDYDKFAITGLNKQAASKVSSPIITESPLNIECKVRDIVSLGSHDMFISDILAVNVDSQLIDDKGKLHLDKCSLAAYAHGEYFELGKKIGTFGFSVRKKKKRKRS
ncbi:flavin reductase family protein [Alkalibaculum sp. M08DMB]|uniref:Flavin reductase family protein n=2 Tax=Alkalibaculum sporogenes TaxID=2655001 RepID=A0A6A7K8R2_9FIRM|nr:flavin reductase family protein [Alkalibaculum sporogenes]MPW25814.1 flavin reductase family protein [Alkalibaculum sporogenes]